MPRRTPSESAPTTSTAPAPLAPAGALLADLTQLEPLATPAGADAEASELARGAAALRWRTRPVRRLARATLAEAHDDRWERAYAIVALACAQAERERRGGRRGPRAKHIAAVIEEWQAWAPFECTRDAVGVGLLIAEGDGRASVCGLAVRVRETHDSHQRYVAVGVARYPLDQRF